MSDPVDFSKQGAIGVITINNPPVNALSQAVRKGIHEGVEQGLADDEVTAMVLIGGGRTFVAGADIREFGKPLGPPDLLTVIATIEASPKLVVAALHGTPLGGGLELALGCHYRCALASTRVGLPEVKLGLLPGAGGTQRLPRVAGIPLALKMITSGDPIPAAAAKEAGIVDEIVEGDLLDDAVAYANKLVADGVPLRKIRDLDDKLAEARDNPGIFDDFRKGMAKKARGYLAPWKCVDSVENAVKLPFDEGQKREREIFTECMASTESKQRRRSRRRHHGRWHRHELRQRGHPGASSRGEPGSARPRPGGHPRQLRQHRLQGPPEPGGHGQAHGAHPSGARLRRHQG
jgi:3-hydroxyacyl-CoA dehydrogenase